MSLADNLKEEVRSLLAERKITKLVADQEVRCLIKDEFFEE